MGAEVTDPMRACMCCATAQKIGDAATIGSNTMYTADDHLSSNIEWIIRIQAFLKGKFYRMRYLKRREERRRKSTHFLIQDQLETISKRRIIQLHMLFDTNEAELEQNLVTRTYQYRTSGATYDGQWLGGFRHGRGTMKFRDGAFYEGTWYLGRAHGYGKFTHVQGETYEGDWADDMRHGKGISRHVNKFVFEGQYKKDQSQGIGKESYPDGMKFVGNFENGKRNGYGIQRWPDQQVYAGNYKDGHMEGFGVYTWPDGKEFQGSWKNQKLYGFGIQTYPDGRRYEGFYKLDKKHGYGIYENPDHSSYSGGWYEGKMHGYGVVYSKNQHKYGLYRQGQKILKLSSEQACLIQDGDIDLENTNQIQVQLGEEKLSFWAEIKVLTNKFEAFDTFMTEQAKFELNRCTQQERASKLQHNMDELAISF